MKRLTSLLIAATLLLTLLSPSLFSEECCIGRTGNIDGDAFDETNVADLTFLVNYLFRAGAQPSCPAEADIDSSGEINVADLTYFVSYLFSGGPMPSDCPIDVVDSVILPLAIGNQWITAVTEYNESGSITAQYSATGTIVGDSSFAGWTVTLTRASAAPSALSRRKSKRVGGMARDGSMGRQLKLGRTPCSGS